MKNGEATVSAKKTAISSARAGAVTALLGVLAFLPLPLDAAIDHGDARSLGTTFAVGSRFPRVVAKDNGDTLDAQDEPLPVLAQDLPKSSNGATAPDTAKDLTDSLWPPKELGVADHVQDWLARANREFQATIIRRLSTPAAGGGADADAIARKIEQVKQEDAEAAALRAKEALDAAQAKLAAEAEAKHSQELSDAAAKAADEAKAREAEAARLEAQRKADKAKRLAEEQKRQDQLRLAAEEKAAQQRAVEAAAAKKVEEERKADAERQALKVAEEAKAKALDEARRKAAEDAKRIAAEQAEKAAAKERELAAQQAAEAAAAKKADEERKADAERQALKAAEEAKAKALEEARRKAAEDAKRIAAEEALKAAADREAKAKEAAEKVRLAEEAAKRDADAKRASESAKQAMVEDTGKVETNVAAAPSAAEPPPVKAQPPATVSKKTSSRGGDGVVRKRIHPHANAHRAVKRHVAVAANDLARGPVVKPWVRRARQGRCRAAGEKILLPGRYTVARGDNLWLIALRHYRTGYYFRRIYLANRDIIRNPNRIYACQRLYLPRR